MSIDTKTREFQFKLLHHILFTNYDLKRRGMEVSPACTFCKQEDETLKHLFHSCNETHKFWQDFLNFFKDGLTLYNLPSLSEILFGNITFSGLYNHLLLLAKRHIYFMKMKNLKPHFQTYFNTVKYNYHIEYIIAVNRDKLERHCNKWILIHHLIL